MCVCVCAGDVEHTSDPEWSTAGGPDELAGGGSGCAGCVHGAAVASGPLLVPHHHRHHRWHRSPHRDTAYLWWCVYVHQRASLACMCVRACCWIGMELWSKCVHVAELVWNCETDVCILLNWEANVCMLLNWFGIVKQMCACCWIGMEWWMTRTRLQS